MPEKLIAKIDGKLEVEILPDRIDDVELIEIIDNLQKENPTASLDFVKFLVGEDGYKRIKEYYKKKNGRMSTNDLVSTIDTLSGALNPKG